MARPVVTPDENDTSFASRLKRYRIRNDLTIEDAANGFETALGTYRGWENGRTPSNPDQYIRIVGILDKAKKRWIRSQKSKS